MLLCFAAKLIQRRSCKKIECTGHTPQYLYSFYCTVHTVIVLGCLPFGLVLLVGGAAWARLVGWCWAVGTLSLDSPDQQCREKLLYHGEMTFRERSQCFKENWVIEEFTDYRGKWVSVAKLFKKHYKGSNKNLWKY